MVGTPRRTPSDTRRTPPDTAGQSDTPRTSNAGHTGHMSSDTSDTSDICPRYVLGHTFGHCPDTVGHTGHIGQPGLRGRRTNGCAGRMVTARAQHAASRPQLWVGSASPTPPEARAGLASSPHFPDGCGTRPQHKAAARQRRRVQLVALVVYAPPSNRFLGRGLRTQASGDVGVNVPG